MIELFSAKNLSDFTAFTYILCVLLSTGVCAAIIDIGATWMSDLKEGICIDAFWFNREQCCWAANDTGFDQEYCSQVRNVLGWETPLDRGDCTVRLI